MTHEQLKALLPLYIDNGLDKEEKEIIKKHLQECEECKHDLKLYQKNFATISKTKDIPLPLDFQASTINKIKEEEKKKRNFNLDKLKAFLTAKVKIPVAVLGSIVAVLLFFVLIYPTVTPWESGEMLSEQDYPSYQADFQTTEMGSIGFRRGDIQTQTMQTNKSSELKMDSKIIYNANLEIEIKDIDIANDFIIDLVQEKEGIIANSSRWTTATDRNYLRFILRIPANAFYLALNEIEGIGKVKYSSLSGQDVTEDFIDLNSRLQNLIQQEKRYRELLNQAVNVEEILKIEKELERVRSSIESLEGRLQYLSDQVDLSTINVEIREVEPIISSNWQLISVLRQALREMNNTIYNLIIKLGALLPYFFILFIAFFIYRGIKKN